jgi:hypothetical protein
VLAAWLSMKADLTEFREAVQVRQRRVARQKTTG